MGRCLAMGWGSVITGAGWGRGAVQQEVHEGVNRKLVDQSGLGSQIHVHMYAVSCKHVHTYTVCVQIEAWGSVSFQSF